MFREWMRADDMTGRTVSGGTDVILLCFDPIKLFFWPLTKMLLTRLEDKNWRSWRIARGMSLWAGVSTIAVGCHLLGYNAVALYVAAIQLALGAIVIYTDR